MQGGRRMKSYFRVTNISAHPFENTYVKRVLDKIKSKLHYDNPDRHIHICDPFSNNKTIRDQGSNLITNDLNPNFDSTYNLEANDFGELMEREGKLFDLVLFDPPYSLRQLKDCYEGIGKELPHWQSQNMWGRCKDALASCVRPGGYVISFGWSSHGFGKRRGFEKQEIHNLEQSGKDGRYNIQIVIEKKIDNNLFAYHSTD